MNRKNNILFCKYSTRISFRDLKKVYNFCIQSNSIRNQKIRVNKVNKLSINLTFDLKLHL